MNITDRSTAVKQIEQLMRQFDISPQELQKQLTDQSTGEQTASNLLVKVLSYIGGIFIFAGLAAFVALQWDEMNSAARVIITLGTGTVCFIAGVLGLSDPRFNRMAMPLIILAAVLQPIGMMVAFDEYGGGGDERVAALLTSLALALQFGLSTLRFRSTIIVWFTLFFTSTAWGIGLDLLDVHEAVIALTLGVSWLCFGVSTANSVYNALSAQLFLFGCWAFLWGLFDLVEDTAVELLFVAATCGLIYLGVWAKSRMLNLAATIGLLAYTAYFTSRHFADSIGWPIALILIGLLMLGISAVALKIDRNYLRTT